MNILVTGASGFIGTNLLEMLIEDKSFKKDKIIVLSQKKIEHPKIINVSHKNYRFTKEDFILQGIETIDVVLHLGAFTPKNSVEANDINKSISNIVNTKYLCDNIPSTPTKFIFCSTLDVYMSTNELITEQTPTIPDSLYGQSKLFCEKILEQWAKENNVILQILRIGHIYGKGEDAYQKIIPISMKAIISGNAPVILSDGSEKRSFLNVSDCCRYILKAIEIDEFKDPINIVSNHSISIIELVNMIIEVSKEKINPRILNKVGKTKNFTFDNSKMIENLGNEVIPLVKGLMEEYEYFKSKYK